MHQVIKKVTRGLEPEYFIDCFETERQARRHYISSVSKEVDNQSTILEMNRKHVRFINHATGLITYSIEEGSIWTLT